MPSGDPRSLGVDTRNGMEHKRVSYSSLLAASLVTSARCRWWRLRYRGAMPSGAINIADATWTLSGEGAATPGSLTAVVVVLLQGVGGRVRGMLVVRGVFCRSGVRLQRQSASFGLGDEYGIHHGGIRP